MVRGLKKCGHITRPFLCTSIHVVVWCTMTLHLLCWLRDAVLGALGGRYTFLSVEHGELDRNY